MLDLSRLELLKIHTALATVAHDVLKAGYSLTPEFTELQIKLQDELEK